MTEPQDLPTHPDFARLVEQAEVDAWLDLDLPGEDSHDLELHPVDEAILLLNQSNEWPRSRIFNLGIGKPATRDILHQILQIAEAAGVASVWAEVSPIARPGTLTRMLRQEGFQQTDRTVIVARHTGGMEEPHSYFRIRSPEQSDTDAVIELLQGVMQAPLPWSALLAHQMFRPNWRFYLSWEGNDLCALGSIHLHGDMAWLPPIWVKHGFRNRGTQAALIAHAVRDAEANGAQWISSSYPASLPGRTRNFERLGFSMVYLRNSFVRRAGGG
jgi:GNAT superfamily N-acetyltransferase